MLMAHNSRNERMDFLYFFLNNVMNGSNAYKEYLVPVLNEAKNLVEGSIDIYDLSSDSRDVKILLKEIAADWLKRITPSSVSDEEIKELQEIIKDSENSVIC